MTRRHISTAAALLALAVAGVVVALSLAPAAAAWEWTNLPNGYSVYVSSYQNADGSTCHIVRIDGRLMGDDCVDAAAMYVAIDAYVNSTICTKNPAAGGAACAPATTAAPPPVTTSETPPAPPPPPATTTISEPPPAAPAPPPATTTVTVTVTTTTTATTTTVDQSITDRLTAIENALRDLTSRIERLELASAAAQIAYDQAIAAGSDSAAAAELARGTYLNAEYGLGAFA